MSARQYRVLAVDDNEIHCYSLRKLLAAAGFDVTHAHSAMRRSTSSASIIPTQCSSTSA